MFVNADYAASFSALQRAEIAEMELDRLARVWTLRFSALQRAEIAEILRVGGVDTRLASFQCSSTSRNC